MNKIPFFIVMVFLFMIPLQAQVLGPCGTGGEGTEPQTSTVSNSALIVNPVPLPGQQAIDFQLPAVVGNDIKNIKLSDYDGKWRILCFFPAAFTFV
ncbi:hypothetical protein ES705_11888 [subsurface metagenome]